MSHKLKCTNAAPASNSTVDGMSLKDDICRDDAPMQPRHHADLLGQYQPLRVGMMLECSTGELITRAAFMHHDN